VTTTPALREAVRAIVLDPCDRVMLLRYDENGGYAQVELRDAAEATANGQLPPEDGSPRVDS
jgi:hypothetical protein